MRGSGAPYGLRLITAYLSHPHSTQLYHSDLHGLRLYVSASTGTLSDQLVPGVVWCARYPHFEGSCDSLFTRACESPKPLPFCVALCMKKMSRVADAPSPPLFMEALAIDVSLY